MSNEQFDITWVDVKREPQCPADPNYPDGIDITTDRLPSCKAILPYPAKRIGYYIVECLVCGVCAGCTTAGRRDDPRSITLPCRSNFLD